MRTKNVIIGAIILVLALVIVGGMLLFSGEQNDRPGGKDDPTEIISQATNTVTGTSPRTPQPTPPAQPTLPPVETTVNTGGDGPPLAMVELASVPLIVRDVSGQQIGDGTVRYYAPERINYPDSVRIELEIEVDRLYITPAPDNPSPVPFITVTPRPGQAIPTERAPSYENSGMIVAQRMGASLICNTEQFSGCTEDPDVSDAKIVDIEDGASWSWIIASRPNVNGQHELLLQVWTLQTVNNGPEQPSVVWQDSFQVQVYGTLGEDNLEPEDDSPWLAWIAVLIGLLLVAGLVGGGVIAWRRVQPFAAQPKVFLSYQRKTGWAVARTINDRLKRMGAEVFIDVDDINEGRFASIIESAIQSSDYFVPVLAPGTLESEWVRREIATALKLNKVIIPVLVSGFMLENLPPDIADLSTHNAVTMTPEYFEAGMNKLARCVGLKAE